MFVAILGSGMAALSAAYHLQRESSVARIAIFEPSNSVGGLCSSAKFDEIEVDRGPHILFSASEGGISPIVELLKENVVKLERNNKILINNNLFSFPLEYHLHNLPWETRDQIQKEISSVQSYSSHSNMSDFFQNSYGKKLSELFLLPYNQKLLKADLCKIECNLQARLPTIDLHKIIEGSNSSRIIPQGPGFYPQYNGIEALINALKNSFNKKVTIDKNCNLLRINKNRSLEFSNETITPDLLINTLPMQEFYRYYPEPIIQRHLSDLRYNSIYAITLKINRLLVPNYQSILLPENKYYAHRVTNLNFLYPLRKIQYQYLMFEYSFNELHSLEKQYPSQIETCSISDVKNFYPSVKDSDIIDCMIQKIDYAYIRPNLNSTIAMNGIKSHLSKNRIYSLGRWGNYSYLNIDQIFHHSKKAIKELI